MVQLDGSKGRGCHLHVRDTARGGGSTALCPIKNANGLGWDEKRQGLRKPSDHKKEHQVKEGKRTLRNLFSFKCKTANTEKHTLQTRGTHKHINIGRLALSTPSLDRRTTDIAPALFR